MAFEPIRSADWLQELRAQFSAISAEHGLWMLRMAVLAFGLAACLVAIVRLLSSDVSPLPATQTVSPNAPSPGAQQALDAPTVVSWAWYSEPKEDVAEVIEAPIVEDPVLSQTRLALRLEGIVVGASAESSLAIIEINGKSDRYAIGASLPVGRNVFLRAIKRHAVHLENSGKLEELPLFTGESMLDQRKVERRMTAGAQKGVIDKSTDPQVVSMLGRYRQVLQRNPQAAGRLLRYEVHIENGQATGFKIGPAGNAGDFTRLGLRENDIVTHVNGLPLADFSQSASLLQQLESLSEVRVQLLRQGQTQEIVYRLPSSN